MSVKCFLVDENAPDFHEQSKRPGAMWLCPWYIVEGEPVPSFLSKHYAASWFGRRAPISVRCPNGALWMPDQGSANGEGWTVTGDVPEITCSPSILVHAWTGETDSQPSYHGFLQAGVFTDDLDGQHYDDVGKLV
jgi:hypothetical protein